MVEFNMDISQCNSKYICIFKLIKILWQQVLLKQTDGNPPSEHSPSSPGVSVNSSCCLVKIMASFPPIMRFNISFHEQQMKYSHLHAGTAKPKIRDHNHNSCRDFCPLSIIFKLNGTLWHCGAQGPKIWKKKFHNFPTL